MTDALSKPPSLLSALDQAPLDASYWRFFATVALCSISDFFDFFIAGFLLSVLAPLWQLTYGQSAILFVSAGIGSIIGSLVGGLLSDRIGRRPIIIAGCMICGLSAGGVALIPDGGWQVFAVLRAFTGTAVGAAYSAVIAIMVERTPSRHRTLITSLGFIAPSAGVMCATLAAATLLDTFGWRGLAALGAFPLVPGLLALAFIPESIPWNLARGRMAEARRLASRQLGRDLRDLDDSTPRTTQTARLAELLSHPRACWLVVLAWFGVATAVYGIYAWGPTIIALSYGVSAQRAAQLFILVSGLTLIGKFICAYVQSTIGRRRTGQVSSAVAAVLLAATALASSWLPGEVLFGLPLLLILLALSNATGEGGAVGLAPYSAEVFPVRLAARGAGLGQAASGFGKLAGPLSLAMIAGTDNLVAPKATVAAVLPGFLFLAACFGIASLAYTFLGIETHGKALSLNHSGDGEAVRAASAVAPS